MRSSSTATPSWSSAPRTRDLLRGKRRGRLRRRDPPQPQHRHERRRMDNRLGSSRPTRRPTPCAWSWRRRHRLRGGGPERAPGPHHHGVPRRDDPRPLPPTARPLPGRTTRHGAPAPRHPALNLNDPEKRPAPCGPFHVHPTLTLCPSASSPFCSLPACRQASIGSRPMDTRPAGWSCVDRAAQPRASASIRWNWCTPCSMVGENRPVV